MPAIVSPSEIYPIAFQYEIPNKNATRLPVQPPLPGRGMATKIIKIIAPYFLNEFSCFLRVFSKSLVKKRLKKVECFIKNEDIGPRIHTINKQGTILPNSPHIKALSAGRPSRKPRGMAPLNSVTGTIAEKNTINSGGI